MNIGLHMTSCYPVLMVKLLNLNFYLFQYCDHLISVLRLYAPYVELYREHYQLGCHFAAIVPL